MRFIKTFGKTFWRSVTDPHYYADVIKAPFGFSFKYFLLFYFLLSAVMTAFVAIQVLPGARNVADEGVDALVQMYPEDLQLTMDFEAGELSTEGVAEPIVIPIPIDSSIEDNIQINPDVDNLLVIDTNARVDDFLDYNTIALATKTELVVMADEDVTRYQVIPFSQFSSENAPIETGTGGQLQSFMVDRDLLDSGVPGIKAFLHQMILVAPWFIFLGVFVFMVVSRLVYLLVMSLFVLTLASLTGRRLTYAKSYQLGTHTVTVADLVTKVQFLLYPTVFPFLFSLAFLGTSLIALMGVRKARGK